MSENRLPQRGTCGAHRGRVGSGSFPGITRCGCFGRRDLGSKTARKLG
jgi:hypothetical protein